MDHQGICVGRVCRLFESLLFSALFVAPSTAVAQGAALPEGTPPAFTDHLVLLPGERVLVATVQEIAGGMGKVNMGELEPRVLPIKGAIEKGIWALKIERREA